MKKNPKRIIITCIILAVVLGVGGAYALSRKPTTSAPVNATSTSASGAKNPGPTDQEKKDTQNFKDQPTSVSPQKPVANGTKRSVMPVITSESVAVVRGYVPGVVEDGGSCVAVYSHDGASFTKTSTGFMNANNTICNVIQTTRSDFSATGTWKIILSYASVIAEGSSSPATFEVK